MKNYKTKQKYFIKIKQYTLKRKQISRQKLLQDPTFFVFRKVQKLTSKFFKTFETKQRRIYENHLLFSQKKVRDFHKNEK